MHAWRAAAAASRRAAARGASAPRALQRRRRLAAASSNALAPPSRDGELQPNGTALDACPLGDLHGCGSLHVCGLECDHNPHRRRVSQQQVRLWAEPELVAEAQASSPAHDGHRGPHRHVRQHRRVTHGRREVAVVEFVGVHALGRPLRGQRRCRSLQAHQSAWRLGFDSWGTQHTHTPDLTVYLKIRFCSSVHLFFLAQMDNAVGDKCLACEIKRREGGGEQAPVCPRAAARAWTAYRRRRGWGLIDCSITKERRIYGVPAPSLPRPLKQNPAVRPHQFSGPSLLRVLAFVLVRCPRDGKRSLWRAPR